MFHTKTLGNIKTLFLCSLTFRKSCRLWDNVEKIYRRRGQGDSMVYAHCMLHN